jgi:DNA mismatch repair ATPase MutS
MEVIKNDDNIEYTYKFNEGISNIKGGINVLKDLNYPDKIINKTEEIIKTLE